MLKISGKKNTFTLDTLKVSDSKSKIRIKAFRPMDQRKLEFLIQKRDRSKTHLKNGRYNVDLQEKYKTLKNK